MAFSPRCSVTKKQMGYFHTKTNDETNDKTNDKQNWQKHTRTKNTYILHIVANMLSLRDRQGMQNNGTNLVAQKALLTSYDNHFEFISNGIMRHHKSSLADDCKGATRRI